MYRPVDTGHACIQAVLMHGSPIIQSLVDGHYDHPNVVSVLYHAATLYVWRTIV